MENSDKTVRELLIMGSVSILLGVLAIVAPFQPSFTFEVCIGTIFVVVGTGHALHSFWGSKREGFFFELFGGAHYLLVGLMLLGNANSGTATFTLLLALLLIMQGMIQFGLSSDLEPRLSKACMFASASAAVFLGVLLWSQWTSGATWLIGLFAGIHLLSRGFSILVLATSIQHAVRLNLLRLPKNDRDVEENGNALNRKTGPADRLLQFSRPAEGPFLFEFADEATECDHSQVHNPLSKPADVSFAEHD